MTKAIILKSGKEKSVLRFHPWIFSGAIAEVISEPVLGETIMVMDYRKQPIAIASYSPYSGIRARIWSWDVHQTINTKYFEEKIRNSIEIRKNILKSIDKDNNACRLVYAESDFVPGLIVDRYADWLVVQFLTTGAEYWKNDIVTMIADITGCQNIYERSDADVRDLEGLPISNKCLQGQEPPDKIEIIENGMKLVVDIKHGQKTGFFLDQRENRKKIIYYAAGRDALDCFSYSGGFTIPLLLYGANKVISIDSSREALSMVNENCKLNGVDMSKNTLLEADVFTQLRKFRDEGRNFDLIILDPPKFAPTSAQVQRAARGYKDINLLAFKLLRPGGILFTFSCSGGMSSELFQKIVADAALDAGVHARILEKLHQSRDHPIALHFPEGEYLKGLICQI